MTAEADAVATDGGDRPPDESAARPRSRRRLIALWSSAVAVVALAGAGTAVLAAPTRSSHATPPTVTLTKRVVRKSDPGPTAASFVVHRHPQVVQPAAGVVGGVSGSESSVGGAEPSGPDSFGVVQPYHHRMPPPLRAPPLGAPAEAQLERIYEALGSQGAGAALAHGGVLFDGKVIAAWIAPILEWARGHGWTGQVTSGYRSFSQQQGLHAQYMAGGNIAAAPGQSNHEKLNYPGGAVDVSNASQLASVLRGYPGRPNLVWGGPVIGDYVHFSANGH